MATAPTPEQTRAQDALFVAQCSLGGLRERLPLAWPTSPDIPPSPKKRYRSWYVHLGWQELEEPSLWQQLSPFDWLLRLVDFSGLRPLLAQLQGWTSARGWIPFDPVSLFLLSGWQMLNRWTRAETLRNLRQPRYADYAQRFGFDEGVFPTEGGLRHFLTSLGQHAAAADESVALQPLNRLLAQAVQLLRQAGLFSPQAWQQALICPDGQLHDAASRMRCTAVTDSCYQPSSTKQPRPCPAKEKGLRGCDCDSLECVRSCRYATPRDRDARFVYYTPDNQEHPAEHPGQAHYGYRSLPLRLADPQRRFSVTLLETVLPANQREEIPASALLLQLAYHYPALRVAAVAADAGLGYEVFLHTTYAQLHARRIVAPRRHQTDAQKEAWPLRGYDNQGRPLCPFGYAFRANGFDQQRQRLKWICARACLKGSEPRVCLPNVTYPPPECPYQAPEHPYGRILNVGERFPDGSMRLVRDLPVGTPAWKALYQRGRNAVEGRNATMEDWRLKRLPVYGLPRSSATLFIADTFETLITLARLIREATAAALEDP